MEESVNRMLSIFDSQTWWLFWIEVETNFHQLYGNIYSLKNPYLTSVVNRAIKAADNFKPSYHIGDLNSPPNINFFKFVTSQDQDYIYRLTKAYTSGLKGSIKLDAVKFISRLFPKNLKLRHMYFF